jgi:hypothetical protein
LEIEADLSSFSVSCSGEVLVRSPLKSEEGLLTLWSLEKRGIVRSSVVLLDHCCYFAWQVILLSSTCGILVKCLRGDWTLKKLAFDAILEADYSCFSKELVKERILMIVLFICIGSLQNTDRTLSLRAK